MPSQLRMDSMVAWSAGSIALAEIWSKVDLGGRVGLGVELLRLLRKNLAEVAFIALVEAAEDRAERLGSPTQHQLTIV